MRWYRLVCIFVLGCVCGWGLEPASLYEEFVNPERIGAVFTSESEVKAFLQTNKTALGYYQVGVFYMYHAYGVLKVMKVSSKDARRLTREAINVFEKAEKLESREPMLYSMLGGAYLFSSQWGSVMDKMRNGRKGVFYNDKAVLMAPENLRIRENRLRNYLHLPPEYFPNIYQSIPEDADKLLAGVEKYQKEYGEYAREVRALAYYGKGLVAFYKKDRVQARENLQKVEKNTSLYDRAQELLKRVGD
ncbi:hypothetical protein [Thermospira aquatica]|uniref:Tetratricopeptide repeat protein n=1 Tax=Thermospira aquatica TaxID=2828656 RepID=A0AAX3BG50_9SPIR|nr:hypothetical protein [Thermospira aquatica]URA11004.1 hypothetical protein KDW03_04160 [Thermospira aquatica]